MSIQTNSVTAYGLTTYFELSWSETTSLVNNTSTLSFTLTTRQDPSGSGYQRTINSSGSQVVIDGQSYAISSTKAYDGLVIWSTSGVVIQHNSDGTKAINASIKVNVGGDYVSGSGTINLTTIQRVSPVSVSPSLLTSGNATITVSPYVSTYTHTVKYTVNGSTTTLATKSTSKTFTIAYSTLENKIGQYRSADVQISCTTYTGNTELGTSYATFTVQTGKIPFSLYDDKQGNIGVTIGEQASQSGFRVMCDDVYFKNTDWIPTSRMTWTQAWSGKCVGTNATITCTIPTDAVAVLLRWTIGNYCSTMYLPRPMITTTATKYIVSDETYYAGGSVKISGTTLTYVHTGQSNTNCYMDHVYYLS